MNEKSFDFNDLYIVDFVKSLGRKKNIFAVIYLVINALLISLMMSMFEPNPWLCLLYGLLLYGLTATLALSPLGEWLFRKINGCKKIEDPAVLKRMQPLFDEVKQAAKTRHPEMKIEPSISLYVCDNEGINAFAMGRRTVCVTRGLLQLPDDQIKGILGHEFGHLATHDTDLTLLITVGNLIVSAIVTMIRIGVWLFDLMMRLASCFLGESGSFVELMASLSTLITTVCINGLMWVWTKLGILLVMKSSREAEYEADAFACGLGYSDGLLTFFRWLASAEDRAGQKDSSIFAALSASHPETTQRIARIETLPAASVPAIES